MHFVLVFVLTISNLAPITQDTLQMAIWELQVNDFSEAHVRVDRKRAAIAAVWAQGRGNASQALPHLLKHVRFHRSWPVWQDAVAAACAVATPEEVAMITDTLRGELDALAASESTGETVLRERLIYRTTTMCAFFIDRCIPLLPDGGQGLPALLELLTEMEVPAERGWRTAGDPLKAAMSRLPDDIARSQHVVQYVRRLGTDGVNDHEWGTLALIRPYLNDTVKSALRTIVQESLAAEQSFNRAAAGVLADWGDQQMLPILTDLQEIHGPQFAADQINLIELQNPPEQLLQLIGADTFDGTDRNTYWSIQRAVEHGLSQDEIVAAVTSFANLDLNTLEWRFLAMHRKAAAVNLGLLQPDSLAEIPYYSRKWATAAQREKQLAVLSWCYEGPNGQPPPNCDVIPDDFDEAPTPHTPPPIEAPFGDEQAVDSTNWQPSEANHEEMAEWMNTIDWSSLSAQEAFCLLEQKLCELDLSPPYLCAEYADENE